MITLYEKKTGKPVPLQDNQVEAALESGEYGFIGDVNVLDPDGALVPMPAEEAVQGLPAGYKFETDEEMRLRKQGVSGLEQKILGVALPAIGAATFGASDVGLNALVDVQSRLSDDVRVMGVPEFKGMRKDIAKVQGASGPVGEVLGTVAGMIGGGAPGIASQVGREAFEALAPTGASFARRLGARAFSEGLEGGIYGVAQLVRDSQVDENPNLSAEKMLATVGVGMGTGALLGAGAEALLKPTAWGASKAASGALESTLKGATEEGAIVQYAKKSDLKRAGLLDEDEIRKVGRLGLDEGWFGLRPEDTVQKAGLAKEQIGEQINAVLDRSAKGFQVDFHKISAEMTDALSDMEVKPGVVNPMLEGARAQLEGVLESFRKLHAPGQPSGLGFRQTWDMQTKMLHATNFGQSRAEAAPYLAKMRKAFRDETLRQLDDAVPGAKKLMQHYTSQYRAASIIEELAHEASISKLGNRWLGMSEMLSGIGGAAAGGPLGGIAGLAGRKAWDVYGKGAAVLAGNRLAQTKVIGRAASGLLKFVEKGLESGPSWGGAFRATLANAAAEGAGSLFDAHAQLVHSDPNYLPTLGLTPDSSEQFQEAMSRSSKLDVLSERLADRDAAIDRAMEGFLGKSSAGQTLRLTPQQLKDMRVELEAFLRDPKPNQALVDLDPTLAAVITSKQLQASQYLLDVMPRHPDPQLAKSLQTDWEPSALELARFARVAQTIQRPETVIENLTRGMQSPEQMEALRKVYPEMLAEARQRMMERLVQHSGKLSYKQRLALTQFMGMPVGGAGTRVDLIQMSRQQQQQQVEQAAVGSSPDGRQVVDSAKNLETQDQRIEARGGSP